MFVVVIVSVTVVAAVAAALQKLELFET